MPEKPITADSRWSDKVFGWETVVVSVEEVQDKRHESPYLLVGVKNPDDIVHLREDTFRQNYEPVEPLTIEWLRDSRGWNATTVYTAYFGVGPQLMLKLWTPRDGEWMAELQNEKEERFRIPNPPQTNAAVRRLLSVMLAP